MPRDDLHLRVQDMLEAIQRIQRVTAGLDRASFADDEAAVDAVLFRITVIGEAARRLPDDLPTELAAIPWQDVRDMRNLIVHAYHRIDVDRVWDTVVQDLPLLAGVLGRWVRAVQDADAADE